MRFVFATVLVFVANSVFGQTQDALNEVNEARAVRGLPPFQRDDLLTQAAAGCAEFRAARGIQGHTSNDFAAVPAGGVAHAAGCAAWPQGMGWGACCTYDGYTHAGAAVCVVNGIRYMHLFVRGVVTGTQQTVMTVRYRIRRGR